MSGGKDWDAANCPHFALGAGVRLAESGYSTSANQSYPIMGYWDSANNGYQWMAYVSSTPADGLVSVSFRMNGKTATYAFTDAGTLHQIVGEYEVQDTDHTIGSAARRDRVWQYG